MAAAVTYEGDVRRSEQGNNGLFTGQKLWFSHAVPSRSWLIENARLNGAQIVQLEQQADVKLVDHAKKNQAPGTHSYRYVELSIRKGQLEELDAHRVGSSSRVDRPVGSVVTAPKGGRNRFTETEDQLLWDIVKPYMDAGGTWKGNEIYKQLESLYPNHTYQSWRDRWIKYTQFQNRQATSTAQRNGEDATNEAEQNPRASKRRKIEGQRLAQPPRANIGIVQSKQRSPSPGLPRASEMGNTNSNEANLHDGENGVQQTIEDDNVEVKVIPNEGEPGRIDKLQDTHQDDANVEEDWAELKRPDPHLVVVDEERGVSADDNRLPLAFDFTQNEARMLYKATCHILDARPDKLDGSWAGVAKEHGHTKDAWRKYFYEVIVPEYMKRHDIHNPEDLQVHYKAELQAERERKLLLAQEVDLDEGEDDTAVEEDSKEDDDDDDNDGDEEDDDNDEDDEDDMEVDEDTQLKKFQLDGSATSSLVGKDGVDSGRMLDTQNLPVPNLHSIVTDHRPPQPNESRKLSQGRSSQSTSSYTQPLSTQQSEQRRPAPKNVASTVLNDPGQIHQHQETAIQTIQEAIPEKGYASFYQDREGQSGLQGAFTISQKSSGRGTSPDRFVTQISEGQQTSSTESSTQLQDIPFASPVLPHPRLRSTSPLFIPKDPEQSSQRVVRQSQTEAYSDRIPELHSSPSVVHLIDNDISEGSAYCESIPSEAPSEVIRFETQARLSQAWETAPEHAQGNEVGRIHDANGLEFDSDGEPTVFDEWRTTMKANEESGADTLHKALPVDELTSQDSEQTRSTDMRSTQSTFKTALAVSQEISKAEQQNGSAASHFRLNRVVNGKPDTQSLFQQPTQIDLAEMAAIPEPPGGWGDEIDLTEDVTTKTTTTNVIPLEEEDWTLPLPDPDISPEDLPSSPSGASTKEDVDTWLTNQPKLYSTIPSTLIKPLSHRALESTSMDLDLATTVLARMVQRFEKGKHPAHLSASDIKKLPKSQRKAALAKLAEDLVPADIPGCWLPEDDRALLGVNGREVKRVEDKHGPQMTKHRFEFLEMWNAAS